MPNVYLQAFWTMRLLGGVAVSVLLMPCDSIESKEDIGGIVRAFEAFFEGLRTLVLGVHPGNALSGGKQPQTKPIREIES